MDINLPIPAESQEARIPGLFRIDAPFPLTTRRIGLNTSHGKYHWAPSFQNLKDLNKALRKSYSGYVLFCFPQKDEIYIMTPSNEETEELCQMLQERNEEVAKAFIRKLRADKQLEYDEYSKELIEKIKIFKAKYFYNKAVEEKHS